MTGGDQQLQSALTHAISLDDQGLPVSFHFFNGETVVKLLEPIKYVLDMGDGLVIEDEVPAGFVSDGCSLPRFFWRLVGHPFDMRYLREAIWHDWMYWERKCSRLMADAVFNEALLRRNAVSEIKIEAITITLRRLGWYAWWQNGRAKARGEIKIFPV